MAPTPPDPGSEASLEAYLHQQIPLSAAMGVRVLRADAEGTILSAPLEPNLNHRATAFGGSVAALAILAGWATVHRRLHAEGHAVHTVIQDARVRFDIPVDGAFEARCAPPDPERWARFVKTLARRGRARIRMDVEVWSEGRKVGALQGAYVALTRPDAPA